MAHRPYGRHGMPLYVIFPVTKLVIIGDKIANSVAHEVGTPTYNACVTCITRIERSVVIRAYRRGLELALFLNHEYAVWNTGEMFGLSAITRDTFVSKNHTTT